MDELDAFREEFKDDPSISRLAGEWYRLSDESTRTFILQNIDKFTAAKLANIFSFAHTLAYMGRMKDLMDHLETFKKAGLTNADLLVLKRTIEN